MKRICLLLEFQVKVVPVDVIKAHMRGQLQGLTLLTFEGDEGELSASRPGRLNSPISTEWQGGSQSRYGRSREGKVFCCCCW